jgi:serine phosphatase RsbU (regulator of sigma subunit)
VLRQENDPFVFRDYLAAEQTRTIENARWNAVRAWVMNGQSETRLPPTVNATSIKTIENGILSYSRSEVEEFMWKLDSTPLASDIGFFSGIKLRSDGIMGTLLENSITGYNAVLIDKTDGIAMINANRRIMLIVSGLIAVCAVILTYFFAGFMVGRIRRISEQAQKVSGGELNIVFPEKGIDEIEDMSISLNAMMRGLREKETLKGEIAAAGEIQKQLLPEKIPATLEGYYSIASFYRAMQGVGGDYYDFIGLDDENMLFCIGDVSNHGVGPAIVMAMARAHLHAIVNRGERDLVKILLELNRQIYVETPPNIFITFFVGIINRTSNEVQYCSAGHLKPVVYRYKTDSIEQLAAGGLPVGMDANDFFAQTISVQKTKLRAGDIFFQYTDGVSEAMNGAREQFSDEKLMSEIKNFARKKTDIMIDEIAHSIERFTGKELFAASGVTELNDDIAMIVFKRIK